MKSTITSDLMFFNALFMLVTWTLLSFIKFFLLSLFIGTITCFLDRPFVVILIHSLGLPLPLMIFWILSILFALRDGKVSLILRTFSVLLLDLEAWAYNFPELVLDWEDFWVLKYLDILLTFLGDLAEIREIIFWYLLVYYFLFPLSFHFWQD